MNLTELLHDLQITRRDGTSTDGVDVTGIAADSRRVTDGMLFVAVKGTTVDGHNYIASAIERGASAIVCERIPEAIDEAVKARVPFIVVLDAAAALGQLLDAWHGHPSRRLTLVGVTGTNGKTTVATLLYDLFRRLGYHVGLISTVCNRIDEETLPTDHTTPDPVTLHALIARMAEAGCSHVFMEVSSHAVDQQRIAGLHYAAGVFTNLTRDHLDYHKTFAAYRDVKKRFFDNLAPTAFALVNVDDKNGAFMLQNTKAQKESYALKTHADYKAHIIESRFDGLLLRINQHEVWTKLIGEFNAYNLLAVYATATLLGMDKLEALTLISAIEPVAGRFQYAVSATGVITIVDYAHTPDALENVLKTINDIRTHNETLTTVVGCGGNRDKGKRPIMADIATTLSDNVILTSDNPRNEEPEAILSEMEQGVQAQHFHKVQTITDRRQAIQSVCKNAQKGDIILIAGKGHETYQEIKGVRHHFDDFEIVCEYLELYKK